MFIKIKPIILSMFVMLNTPNSSSVNEIDNFNNTENVTAINEDLTSPISYNLSSELEELNEDYDENFTSAHEEYIVDDYIYKKNDELGNENKDLTLFNFSKENLLDEFNNHIINTAPSDSPFIGKGEIFINIGEALEVNPYYIYAHASVESGYGKSNMARTKGNYFGIGAYNSDPSQAYSFIDSGTSEENKMYKGLYLGTKWIRDNYFNKQQNSLHKMIFGKKKYAVYDNGEPNTNWMYSISSLMS